MKKLTSLVALLALVLLSSCVSKKEIVYLQGIDSLYKEGPEKIAMDYTLKVQQGDQLSIKISSMSEDALKPFGYNILLGQMGNGSSSSYSGSLQDTYFYNVEEDGYVTLPILGRLYVAGRTCADLEKDFAQRLTQSGYLYDPTVKVRIRNFKISVLGAVKNPGEIQVTDDRITLLQALAKSGDLTTGGLRKNILIVREQDGERVSARIDLTSPDLLQSPYYYLKQNDVVYVEPNSSVRVQSSPYFTFWSASSSILSVLISLVSLISVLSN